MKSWVGGEPNELKRLFGTQIPWKTMKKNVSNENKS